MTRSHIKIFPQQWTTSAQFPLGCSSPPTQTFIWLIFLRQSPPTDSRMAWDSLVSPGWPQTRSTLRSSQMLGLGIYMPTPPPTFNSKILKKLFGREKKTITATKNNWILWQKERLFFTLYIIFKLEIKGSLFKPEAPSEYYSPILGSLCGRLLQTVGGCFISML